MAQYLPKDALVAVIKHHIKEESHSYFCKCLLSEIDALEVKDVDLIKEVANWKIDHQVYGMDETFYDIAKHFFDLGLKAQKG